jgi:FkbM family methyltransferase
VTFDHIFFYVPFFPTDWIQRGIVTTATFYETGILRELTDCVQPGSIVFDIGANIGNHALYWALKRKAGKVYAFEPVPRTFDILVRNIELNCLQNRIIPLRIALSDRRENLSIVHYSLENIGGTGLQKDALGGIPATALDSFEFPEGRVDFVKIDVEGFEVNIIRGGLLFLQKTKPKYIFIEIFPKASREWMAKTLSELGYSIVKNFGNNFLYKLNQVATTNISS